ncbi:MAG: lipid-binding SYLF domain-containing protein [Nitrospira sp.]|nr:lipid-binding SYLF domain-containing protein [Nitrospira sp.]MCY4132344.1 lipid-binding SYLF domain-containing protein [Nitrospira sp.]
MTQKSQDDKQRHNTPLFFWMTALLFTCLCWTPAWADSLEEQQLVEKAKHTVENFMNDPNFTWFQDHVKEAKALVIIPQQLKAAFFFGADGGSGVLVARDKDSGEWTEPAFYVLGGLSFGAQFGGEASEVIILAMTSGAVEKLYASSFKLGGELSYAVGPYGGAGIEGATSANLNADFLSFSRSKGVYLGVSLEGSIISVDDDANEAYYGKKVRPVDILVTKSVKNEHSAGLRQAIMTAIK